MRLIDADKLEEHFKKVIEHYKKKETLFYVKQNVNC